MLSFQLKKGAIRPFFGGFNPAIRNSSLLNISFPNGICYCFSSASEQVSTQKKTYKPSEIEPKWIDFWLSNKFYLPKEKRLQAKSSQGPKPKEFTMLAPPPNVTGTLHLGHAMTASIQDMYARWYRMKGYSVNWVPGTDHAGISTQVVVEKQLHKEKNVSRHQIGREKFIKEVWRWKSSRECLIQEQQKKLGASMNWDEEYFTMDENHSKVVESAFIQLFNDGLIYRDTKMVNWCCNLNSVISDIEVDRIDINQPKHLKFPDSKLKQLVGVLYEFSYQVVNSDKKPIGTITVGTTRPETILGDMAIAVHSKDKRYEIFQGKYAVHPISGELIPVIVDDTLVKLDFGTGAVKVTPSHDIDDYECAKRHNLQARQVINLDGTMFSGIPSLSKFNGLTRWEARREIIEHMKNIDAYLGNSMEKNQPFKTSISVCSRSGDIIEPMLIPQWYVKMADLSQKAISFVKDNKIQILPARFVSHWYNWLEDTQDWCISRQLWWGHQIPAYKVLPATKNALGVLSPEAAFHEFWVAASSREKALEIAQEKLNSGSKKISTVDISITRDEDVLDTWFSSGLLPLMAFNKQNESGDNLALSEKPALSTLLETGNDIIFFWVARMVMLCSYFSGNPPFEKVFLHSMIRDSMGRKMSKSLGNVIDPLSVINGSKLSELKDSLVLSFLTDKELKAGLKNLEKEYPNGIPEYGCDALRMSLILYSQQGQINVDINNIKASYFFANKMWNVYNFINEHIGANLEALQDFTSSKNNQYSNMSLFDKSMLSRLFGTVAANEKYLKGYRGSLAAEHTKNFILKDLCESYIDFVKPVLFGKFGTESQSRESFLLVLLIVFEFSLRLLHPFMPFISEELYESLSKHPLNIQQVIKAIIEKSDNEDYVAGKSSLMVMNYPNSKDYSKFIDLKAESQTKMVLDIVKNVRMVRQTNKVPNTAIIPNLNVIVREQPSISGSKPESVAGSGSEPVTGSNASCKVVENVSQADVEAGIVSYQFEPFSVKEAIEILENYSDNIKHFGKIGNISIYANTEPAELNSKILDFGLGVRDIKVSVSHNITLQIPLLPESKNKIGSSNGSSSATQSSAQSKQVSNKNKDKGKKLDSLIEHRDKLLGHVEKFKSKFSNLHYNQNISASAKESDLNKVAQLETKISRLTAQIKSIELQE